MPPFQSKRLQQADIQIRLGKLQSLQQALPCITIIFLG